jgi:S-DNA-T family DNA segregation ATPase FtsK/SpoIIIE
MGHHFPLGGFFFAIHYSHREGKKSVKNTMQTEAAVILDLLRKRDVRVRVTDGYKTPGFHVYCLAMDPMQRMTKLDETLDDMQSLLYAFRAKHKLVDVNDPDVRVVARTQAQPLALEVNRPTIETLHLDSVQWLAQPFVALAGVSYLTRQGQPLTWNMADPSQPHALVAGSSGSGKSNLLLSLTLSLALGAGPDKLSLFIIDGGNSTLLQLRKLPHARRMATDAEQAIDLVTHVKAIVLDRKAKSLDKPDNRCLLVVDELANLMAVMDKGTAEAFQRDLAIIAAEGRKFGVHMLVCTQKPLAEVTGSLAKSNMAVRFVGAMSSKTDANTAAGSPGTGAERLAGKGDFIRVVGGNVRRFQVPMVDGSLHVIRKIQARWVEVAPLAPVQTEKPLSLVYERLAPPVAPVRTGACTTLAPPLHQSLFPLDTKRPLTEREAAEVRKLQVDLSKNKLCEMVYGAKSPRYMEWINEALAGKDDGKIIKMQRRAAGGD